MGPDEFRSGFSRRAVGHKTRAGEKASPPPDLVGFAPQPPPLETGSRATAKRDPGEPKVEPLGGP